MSDGNVGQTAMEELRGSAVTDTVDDYRRMRSDLERDVLPLATSVDGRQFTFQASLHQLQFQTGGYVILEDNGDRWLGQVLTLRSADVRVQVEPAVSVTLMVSSPQMFSVTVSLMVAPLS